MPFVSIWLKLLLCHAISLIYETLVWMNLFLWFQRFYCSIATITDNLINVKTLGGAVTFSRISQFFFFFSLCYKFLWLEHRAVQWHWTLYTIQYLLQYSMSLVTDDNVHVMFPGRRPTPEWHPVESSGVGVSSPPLGAGLANATWPPQLPMRVPSVAL